ncbi:MAG: ATP-binding protein [Salibacteraceae bacterium]
MVDLVLQQNADALQRELTWLEQLLTHRLGGEQAKEWSELIGAYPVPDMASDPSVYAELIRKHQLMPEERVVFILALTPHIRPVILDVFLQKSDLQHQMYSEFGGSRGKNHIGFIPTGETAAYLLAGHDLAARFRLSTLLDSESTLVKQNLLWLESVAGEEPIWAGILSVSDEVVDQVTTGKIRKPRFSMEFPAQRIETRMDWTDLVLNTKTKEAVLEIETWIRQEEALMNDWGMNKRLKPGYNALFFGPPGTGKSLTASLIGKRTGKEVYRIDLSRLVSKYIGETEKNLSKVFDKAENKGWILFFDEADALFGKRTSVSDSHDRYANQEVSYLLQRIEDYSGLAVLASNLKSNIDSAFIRRFQSIIHFPMPAAGEREKLWRQGFSTSSQLAEDIDLRQISRDYEMAGGSIINAIGYSSLMALDRGTTVISRTDLLAGITKEYNKEGRSA